MRRFHLICILLFSGFSLQAQHVFETYTPSNGLVDSKVQQVTQDKFGRMVFLSRDGISIYDGIRFTNHTEIDGHSIGITETFLYDKDSNLLVPPFTGSTIWINRDNIKSDSSLLNSLSEISLIIALGINDYIIVTNPGMFRYKNGRLIPLDNKSQRFKYRLNNIPLCAIAGKYLVIKRSTQDENGPLIIYDYEKKEIIHEIPVGGVSNLFTDIEGNAYARINTFIYQLKIYPGPVFKLEKPWYSSYLPAGFNPDYLTSDNRGNIFCIGAQGVFRINNKNGETELYSHEEGLMKGVTKVYTDKENNYWFVAYSKGVQKLVQSPYREVKTLQGYGTGKSTYCYRLPDGSVFINTDARQYLIKNDSAKLLNLNARNASGKWFYWNRELWSFVNGGTLLNAKGEKKKILSSDTTSIIGGLVTKGTLDREGNLVMSARNIYVFSTRGEIITAPVFYYSDKIAFDEQNHYWSFDRSGRVEMFELANGRLEKKRTIIYDNKILNPRSAIHWNLDTFLCGTRTNGLLFIKILKDSIQIVRSITRSNGLSNNFILNVERLKPDQIAVATASGLDIIHLGIKDTTIQKLSTGINNYEPIVSMAPDNLGNLYVTSEFSSKLFKYTAGQYDHLPPASEAYFYSITNNGKNISSEVHSFSYLQNNFQFRIAAPTFLDNNNTIFTFTVRHGNTERITTNNKGEIELNNLEPGNFVLLVKISYSGDIYPEKFLEYHFNIRKPFWKTAGFIIVALILISGLIFAFTRIYFVQQLRRREAELGKKEAIEKERNRIATDMHDDFGASLSRIKFLSEKIQLEKSSDPKLGDDLGKISHYSDEMAEKMNEIVWALNRKYDTLGDLVAFSRSYASEYLSDSNINLHFRDEVTEQPLNGEIRRNLFLVLKECLHNTVKHAGATEVWISFTSADLLTLTYTDNGKGIDWDHLRPFANGLENMKKRVTDIGGSLAFGHEKGMSLTITVATSI